MRRRREILGAERGLRAPEAQEVKGVVQESEWSESKESYQRCGPHIFQATDRRSHHLGHQNQEKWPQIKNKITSSITMKIVGCLLVALGVAQAFTPLSLSQKTAPVSQLSMADGDDEVVLNKYSRYVGCMAFALKRLA